MKSEKSVGKLILILSLGAAAMGLSACGSNDEKKSAEFSYELSENGRSTGKQTFASREAMCVGLQNETLNNSNAQLSRQQLFRAECGVNQQFRPFYTNTPQVPQPIPLKPEPKPQPAPVPEQPDDGGDLPLPPIVDGDDDGGFDPGN